MKQENKIKIYIKILKSWMFHDKIRKVDFVKHLRGSNNYYNKNKNFKMDLNIFI